MTTFSAHYGARTSDTRAVHTFATNASMLTFKASSPIMFPQVREQNAKLVIDATTHLLLNTRIDGTSISIACYLDPEAVSADSSCEIVFPAGMFVLGQAHGETVLSPEVRIPLTPDPSMAPIASAGSYQAEYEGAPVLSRVLSCNDGETRFLQIHDGQLVAHTINSENPGHLSLSATVEAQMDGLSNIVDAVALEGSMAFVVTKSANYPPSTTGLWVDLATGAVTAQCDLSDLDPVAFAPRGASVIVASNHYGENPPMGTTLSLLTPQEDGSASAKHAWTSLASPIATSGHLLFSRMSHDGFYATTEDVLTFSLDDG